MYNGGVHDWLGGSAREILFGLEGGVMTMLGMAMGIAAGGQSTFFVLLVGGVLLCVELLLHTAHAYIRAGEQSQLIEDRLGQDHSRILQERISDNEQLGDFLKRKRCTKSEIASLMQALTRERQLWLKEVIRGDRRRVLAVQSPLLSALSLGLAFFLGGSCMLWPYLLFPLEFAMGISIPVAMFITLIAGFAQKDVLKRHPVMYAMKSVVVCLTVAVIGYASGLMMREIFLTFVFI